jgi:MFS family permease
MVFSDSLPVVYTVGLAIVAETVPREEIGYYMGYALSSMSFGVLVGPVVGSIVFGAVGYIPVVGMMGAVAVLDIILRLFMVEKGSAESYGHPLPESARRTEYTRLLRVCNEEGNQYPDHSLGSFRIFTLLANPRIATAIYGVFVNIAILTCFDAVLPIFVGQIFGWTSSLNIAFCFLALAIPNTLLGPVAGKLSDVYGPRWPAFLWV